MSLFDQVDQAMNAEKTEIISAQVEQSSLTPERFVPDPLAANSKRLPKTKPEKLKFLKPCSICYGRDFTHRENGGFFCNSCQPGIDGQLVIALGDRAQPKTVKSLPCAGCGSTTWIREKDGWQFNDGEIADGWHCGGVSCSVSLLSGNKEADRKTIDEAQKSLNTKRVNA